MAAARQQHEQCAHQRHHKRQRQHKGQRRCFFAAARGRACCLPRSGLGLTPVNTAVGILFHRDSPHGQKYSSAEGACGKRNEYIIIEGPGFCPALRHGWPMAKCSSEQRESPWGIEGCYGPGFCPALRHGVVCWQKSSRSCKTLLYYTGYYRQNKALNCELFCSGYDGAPKNTTKDTTPLCFVL